METIEPLPRQQSPTEEIANSLSHGIAFLAAVAALPILVLNAVGNGGVTGIVGASVFGATMVLLYLVSTLYHALPAGVAKRVFLILDHSAIYLLIAGTYTPFTLGVLRGSWGWSLFGIVWGVALLGVVLKGVFGTRYSMLSTGLYLIMGWLVLIAGKTLWLHIPAAGLFWLLAGGIAYTLGVVFFVMDGRVRFAHFVWHLFVITGTACHFVAVMWYAA
jgi:hemolysin III